MTDSYSYSYREGSELSWCNSCCDQYACHVDVRSKINFFGTYAESCLPAKDSKSFMDFLTCQRRWQDFSWCCWWRCISVKEREWVTAAAGSRALHTASAKHKVRYVDVTTLLLWIETASESCWFNGLWFWTLTKQTATDLSSYLGFIMGISKVMFSTSVAFSSQGFWEA